jgi:hypothetical protein
MHPIFRNIGYSPRIWGLSYGHLFTTLFGGLFALMLGRAAGILAGFCLAVAAVAAMYGFFYWQRNADMVEFAARRCGMIGKNLSPYGISEQRFEIT